MKTKIIEVSSDTNIGGAGKCLLTLLENFDYDKFEVSVILPKNSLLKPHIDAMNIPVTEVDGIADKSLDWGAVGKLRKIFKAEKPALVHTH
ncbi:MAG: glycosyltransferase family 1 protein, partial [Oscillospiraceae bacterium]|nr:glycosyltransferase family 1 protein [Oscillospiraceae bacterium]